MDLRVVNLPQGTQYWYCSAANYLTHFSSVGSGPETIKFRKLGACSDQLDGSVLACVHEIGIHDPTGSCKLDVSVLAVITC